MSKNELQKILDNNWSGNIRELENIIEQAVILSEGNLIEPGDIIIESRQYSDETGDSIIDLPDTGIKLEEIEKKLLLQALSKSNGNQTRAAGLLGISRSALRYRMEKHKIPFK